MFIGKFAGLIAKKSEIISPSMVKLDIIGGFFFVANLNSIN